MAERFHINLELAPGLVVVQGSEAHHLGTVCRVRPGDAICLFNGDGREYAGQVVEVTRRDVTVEVHSSSAPERELPFPLHVAVPLPKGDRAQFLVEKLTELGVTTLTLLNTRRSVVQPREAKLDKLERYIIEASKQCGRNVLMRLAPPRDWQVFLQEETGPAARLLAHPGGSHPLPTDIPRDGLTIAIGPEGGFTDEEAAEAVACGWQVVGLGPRILRMETAAIALAARFSLGKG